MRIAFCHPDLGIGGAERLVVDAALELKSAGHQVEIFTSHHDPNHCFVETKNGDLPAIRVHGEWLPRHIAGKFHALFAILRCFVVSLAICFDKTQFDVAFVDQVSAVIPVFRFFRPNLKILFYCHFPDLLLAKKGNWLKKIYRWPLDLLEELSTGMADLILVNSNFTRQIFAETFSRLHAKGISPSILHPAVRVPPKELLVEANVAWKTELPQDLVEFLSKEGTLTFLSINRYERKKCVDLAIKALHRLRSLSSERHLQLIIAGGYDERVRENKEYFLELKQLAEQLDLSSEVFFLRSFTDRQKFLLLSAAAAVVYTPTEEHFGIVPIESMSFERPVIACKSGGPKESIVDNVTGFLAEPSPEAFANSMKKLVTSDVSSIGQNGRSHVKSKFSRRIFGEKLKEYVAGLNKKYV